MKALNDMFSFTVPADGHMRGKLTAGRPQHVPLWPLNRASLFLNSQDLVALDDPNEGLILHCLRERYMEDDIYTWMGASRSGKSCL